MAAPNKPEGFSVEVKEKWWNLVNDCTDVHPERRPTMAMVLSCLDEIYKTVRGKRQF